MITLADIQAAQQNDLAGISAVLSDMEERVNRLAAKAAGSLAANPARFTDYCEDFRQDALTTLFEYLPRWTGDDVSDFRAYLYGAMSGVLDNRVYRERNSGVDRDAFSTFKAMVAEADGNLHRAEQLCRTRPPAGKRLSADRARAARIAWEGTRSLDAPAGEDGFTLADALEAEPQEAEYVVRPKVGHGAALEALSVLQAYCTAREALSALPRSAADVEAIEDAISVPRDPQVRRYVLDAVAILHSYVSTSSESVVSEDLWDVSDERSEDRAAKIADVHAVLADMSTMQAESLRYSFGIEGRADLGWGDGCDLAGLGEALGSSPDNAKKTRSKARKSFAERYVALVGTRNISLAMSLRAAAAANLARGGRK